MKCANCQAKLRDEDITCDSCGKNVLRSKEDLNRVDPKSTAVIGWAVFAIGALAMFFVIINMNVLSLSGLDFVVPTALILLGGGSVLYARSLKK